MNMTSKEKIAKYSNYFINEVNDFDLEYETRMLMYRFISIIDEAMENKNISKKELASRIGTSASYITQLFNGNKIINLPTLAKIQHALGIEFKINEESAIEDLNHQRRVEDYITTNIGKDRSPVYKKTTEFEYSSSLRKR